MTADTESKQAEPQRRTFLRWLARGFLSLWGLAGLWIFAAFLRPPVSRHRFTDRVLKVGSLDSIAPGQALLVRHGEQPFIVVRTRDDSLIGLSAVCTHFNCVLEWDADENILLCPCHDGAFDINGNVLGGPPPRSLQRYRVEVRLGEVFLYL